MGTIRVKVNPHADSGSICGEILAAASAASGKPAQAAEIIRDGNGKVVEVLVGLPDVDAPGLANAEARINENSGVANNGTTVSPNFLMDEDFESFTTPNAEISSPITDLTSGGITRLVMSVPPGRAAEFRASAAVDALAGSVSLKGSDLNTTDSGTFHAIGPEIQWHATDNALTDLGAFELSFTIKKSLTEDGVAKDVGENLVRLDALIEADGVVSHLVRIRAIGKASQLPTWTIAASGAAVDTGVLITSPLSVVVKWDAGGLVTVKAASETASTDRGFVTRGAFRKLRVNMIDTFSSAGVKQIGPVIFDDIKFNVLS